MSNFVRFTSQAIQLWTKARKWRAILILLQYTCIDTVRGRLRSGRGSVSRHHMHADSKDPAGWKWRHTIWFISLITIIGLLFPTLFRRVSGNLTRKLVLNQSNPVPCALCIGYRRHHVYEIHQETVHKLSEIFLHWRELHVGLHNNAKLIRHNMSDSFIHSCYLFRMNTFVYHSSEAGLHCQ